MIDKWTWERDKFSARRSTCKRDSYEMVMFDTLSRLGIDLWIKRKGVELSKHYDGLQMYHLRKKTREVERLQTLLVTPENEVLDFRCESKNEDIPRPPPLTPEQMESKLRENGLWPRRRSTRRAQLSSHHFSP